MSQEITVLKKITLKDMGINIQTGGTDDKGVSVIGKIVALFQGKISGYKVKPTTFGEAIGFSGIFAAVNAFTGECFEASMIYFPGDFTELAKAQCDKLAPGEEFVFEVEISVAKSDRGARGYTFVNRPISTPEVINQRMAIMEGLRGKVALLPAPKPASKKKAA